MVRNCENCEIRNWATRCSTFTKSLNLFFVVFGSRGLSRNTHNMRWQWARTILLSRILSDVAQQPRRPRAENKFSQNDQQIHAHWAVEHPSVRKTRTADGKDKSCALPKTNNSSMSNAHLFLFGAHAPSSCSCSIFAFGSLPTDGRQWTWNLFCETE